MSASGSGTMAETYVETDATVVPQTRVASKSQQVARYLADDLQNLVSKTNLDIAYWLGIPRDRYMRNPQHLVELIFNDVERMLRDRLIIGVHLILSEPALDVNTHGYKVLYHVRYEINIPDRSLVEEHLSEFGGRLDIGKTPVARSRFALIIDWAPRVSDDEIRQIRRPRYMFDWVPVRARYDANGAVRFRVGGLGNVVTRIETIQPNNIRSN